MKVGLRLLHSTVLTLALYPESNTKFKLLTKHDTLFFLEVMWGSTIKTGCCASISGFRWVTDSNKISKALISSSNVWVHCTTVYLCQHWFTLYDSACFAAIATTWKLNKYTSFRLSLLILKLGFSSIYHEPFIPFSIRRFCCRFCWVRKQWMLSHLTKTKCCLVT